MISKERALEILQGHIGIDLVEVARDLGITTFINEKQNKGWKGAALEGIIGLGVNHKQAPDGLDFELKSTAYYKVKGVWTPKETMAITMIKPEQLIATPFYESHCWDKLQSLVFCAVTWYGKHIERAELLKVQSFDFLNGTDIVNEIESDYELIRYKCRRYGLGGLTGADGKWIQARTKGAGHGTISRAFYARKGLLKLIMQF
jgi:DNA mismatch repair protein MutH